VIQTYFGLVTVESLRFFCHFAFCHHGFKLATSWQKSITGRMDSE